MTLRRISLLRRWVGGAGTLCCALFFLVLLDGLNSRLREPPDYFPCLPGWSIPVSGFLPEGVKEPDDLTYVTDSSVITLTIDAFDTGYWLGQPLWRGRILLDAGVKPDRYEVVVFPRKGGIVKAAKPFHVLVFKNATDLRKASASFTRRYLGINPWYLVPLLLFFIIVLFGLVFLLSLKREGMLAQCGRAEVYRVLKEGTDCMIYFALGWHQGILQGTPVLLFTEGGERIGTAIVEHVFQYHSVARTEVDLSARPVTVACHEGSLRTC